ncbi:manganese efflux pump [Bacillus aquiflavi]|uniref:Putative manganese efflux pump MntP n=1 Tax=Bacillus aquiflavi TaxID=2672567 RepID=A0A6B3W078_9BACI|nr:manganese efflux pump MntP family protein [Bacillus aquiflavi]MBA4536626.1 manganese efflux pump [Bacillus aquiflavi]NEY80994.1 manganese efflux pump [Bacillus aquiflavi]UAC47934.1 manganese efflux pump MntP family protein [Bacillus aquiflavi]
MTEVIEELFTLLLIAFALGMDAFSVSLGMGLFKLRLLQIFKIGITIGFFHIWMPLLGIVLGKYLSEYFGVVATYIGGALLVILGVQMLLSSFSSNKNNVMKPIGFGLFIFGFIVSLDSFSVGLTFGIYGARIMLVIISFGVATTILTWTGLILGRKVQGFLGDYSQAFGGSIMLIFGLKLLIW